MSRFMRSVLRKQRQREDERIRLWQKKAVNHIGKVWSRSRERVSLQARFMLRRHVSASVVWCHSQRTLIFIPHVYIYDCRC